MRGLFHANAKRICGQSFDYHIRRKYGNPCRGQYCHGGTEFQKPWLCCPWRNYPESPQCKREEEKVQELAEDFETKVIGKLTHSDLVTDAEEQGKTLMECYPESEMATEYRILAEQILNLCREDGLC